MTDPEAALREQIRVTRKGGVVSAVVCFSHTDNLPHYHGRVPLPGNHRIDLLAYRLWQVWRQTVRPRRRTHPHRDRRALRDSDAAQRAEAHRAVARRPQ